LNYCSFQHNDDNPFAETEMRFLPVPEPGRDELIGAGYIERDESGHESRRQNEPTAEGWAKQAG
jgi:hypothetical protein